MQSANVSSEVETIIATTVGIDKDAVSDDLAFGPEGLDIDSLKIVEMAELLEMEMGVRIPDEELGEMETVGDVKAYAQAELGE